MTRMEKPRARCDDQAADAAQPDDAQGLAVELAALELLASPLAALDEAVGPGDVAAAGQQEAHGVLGRRDDVALRACCRR